MYLHTFDLEGIPITYKGASRAELQFCTTRANNNTLEYYEQLIRCCVISPKIVFKGDSVRKKDKGKSLRIDKLPYLPGHIVQLAQQIEGASGIGHISFLEQMVARATEYINSEEGNLDLMACVAFPGLNPLELKKADPQERWELWKGAEALCPVLGIDSRMFTDPDAYEADVRKQKQQRLIAEKDAEAQEKMLQAMDKKNRRRMSKSGGYASV